jgi:hypothetical protein
LEIAQVKAADQFRSSDVTVWGIAALVIWGAAILGMNLSGLVPPVVFQAMHSPRIDGSSMNQLRAQVAALQDEAARQKRENAELLQRFNLNEDLTGAITRRVGALEVSIPKLVEQQLAAIQPMAPPAIDTTETGSIDTPAVSGPDTFAPKTFDVEGGTVVVRQQPLTPATPAVTFTPLPFANAMPRELTPNGSSIGIGLGFPVAASEADAHWQELLAEAGTMLMGLSPVLANTDGTTNKLIVAGPMTDNASALDLCKRLDHQGIPCQPLPYIGAPMPLLN